MDLNDCSKNFALKYSSYKAKREGFTMVLNQFIERKDCTIYEKMVYISISKHTMRKNYSWPSHKTIAREAGCCSSTVKKAIKGLIAKGLIVKSFVTEHRSCVYTLKKQNSP